MGTKYFIFTQLYDILSVYCRLAYMTICQRIEHLPQFLGKYLKLLYLCGPKTTRPIVMLIRFTVENYRSIGEEKSLDLCASNAIKDLVNRGYSTVQDKKYLNSIAFYGANSSGKTNFLKAIGQMRNIVLHSVRLNDNEPLPYEPFLLSTKEARPTKFEVSFIDPEDRAQFEYGFKYNEDSIVEEWLDAKFPRKSKKHLFTRTGTEVIPDSIFFAEGEKFKDVNLNKNRLFLSLVGQLGGEISNRVIEWFRTKVIVLSGINDSNYYKRTSRNIYESSEYREGILDLIRQMNFGFEDIKAEKVDMSNMTFPQELPAEIIAKIKNETYIEISTVHNVYDEDGNIATTRQFELEGNESAGTNKFFNLAGHIYESLKDGRCLCIDELDSQMHPLISWKIVEMFNNTDINTSGSQLIFTTHDTHLLSKELFRRDQIIFIEKNKKESSDLYTMLDAKQHLNHSPRTDSNYQKNYIQGRYGAIPFPTNDEPEE